MSTEPIKPRDIVDTVDIRKMADVSQRHTLIRWRRDPTFPKPIKVTGRGIELFDRQAVKAWLASRDT